MSFELASIRREIEELKKAIRVIPAAPHDIPLQPMAVPRSNAPQLKLKEIIETIPRINGHNIPVLQLTRACKRALNLFPSLLSLETEYALVRMIRAKSDGHAYLVVEEEELTTVDQLVEILKLAFQPSKSINYYKGQLNNTYKRPNEHVLDYIGRVRDLKQAIIEGETKVSVVISANDRRRIESESFVNELPLELRIPLKLEQYFDLASASNALLRISQIAEHDAERAELPSGNDSVGVCAITADRPNCNMCEKSGHLTAKSWKDAQPTFYASAAAKPPPWDRGSLRPSNQGNSQKEANSRQIIDSGNVRPASPRSTIVCYYCNKVGHVIAECRKRALNNGRRSPKPSTSGNPASDPSRCNGGGAALNPTIRY